MTDFRSLRVHPVLTEFNSVTPYLVQIGSGPTIRSTDVVDINLTGDTRATASIKIGYCLPTAEEKPDQVYLANAELLVRYVIEVVTFAFLYRRQAELLLEQLSLLWIGYGESETTIIPADRIVCGWNKRDLCVTASFREEMLFLYLSGATSTSMTRVAKASALPQRTREHAALTVIATTLYRLIDAKDAEYAVAVLRLCRKYAGALPEKTEDERAITLERFVPITLKAMTD